jgi:hypothetical protein
MNFLKVSVIIILVNCYSRGYAWDDKTTHPTLSRYASIAYFDEGFLKQEVKGKVPLEWIQDGVELEDSGSIFQYINGTARSLNHFHAPNRTLTGAGLTDLKTGISTVLWAQNGPYQVSKGWEDWSWQKVRDHYYNHLTATSRESSDDHLARTLKGLGYQMHLIQDMSQPNHVRNDTHIWDGAGWRNGLETWAKKHDGKVRAILNSSPFPAVPVDLKLPFEDPALAPVARLSDTRAYAASLIPSASLGQGLAEYTNANFFSEDTCFANEGYSSGHKHFFPYPRKAETNLQQFIDNALATNQTTDVDNRTYDTFRISRLNTTGEQLNCIAVPGFNTRKYYQEIGEGTTFYRSFVLDESCYEEYAQKLLPRAVGYSKAMLDYFYRGTIELSLPTRGVYALAAPDGQFTEIRVRARNTTVSSEEMNNGSIQLVIKYRLAQSDPFQSEQVEVGPESYIVVPEKNNVGSISRTTPTELVFDLEADPENMFPLWATNVYIQVVYRGQLGNEADAVAVGFKDISEPTPMDVFNNADKICIYGQWHDAGTEATIALVPEEVDAYAYNIANIFAKASSNTSASYASPTNYTFSSADLLTGGSFRRLGFILTDYSFKYSYREDWLETDPNNPWDNYWIAAIYNGSAVKNQTDPDGTYEPPQMYTFRGSKMWGGAGGIYINDPYPADSECDYGAVQ